MINQLLAGLTLALICVIPGSAQDPKTKVPDATRDIVSLVLEGRIHQAVRTATESPGSAETALRKLMESVDLQITGRKIAEAETTLQAAATFLEEFEKADSKWEVAGASDAIHGRRLRLKGIRLNDQKEYVLAETELRRALEISRRARDKVLEAGIHNNLGYALQFQEKLEEAMAEFESARQMAEAQKDDLRAGSYNFNLGQVLLSLGKPETALQAFQRAEAQNHTAGQTSVEARSIMFEGVTLMRSDPANPEILKRLEKARELFEKLGDDRNAGRTLSLAAENLVGFSRFAEAARYGEMAIPYLKKAGDVVALRTCYVLLSGVYVRLKDPEKSEQYRKLAAEPHLQD
jgi:tetratricopeptide (TPR) repeat protein